MKNIIKFLVVIFLSVSSPVIGQEITGEWNGVLREIPLRLVFKISKKDSVFTSTMDSPDQGAHDIPVTTTTFKNSTLKIGISNLDILYTAKLIGDTLVGRFLQGGKEMQLKLTKGALNKTIRPQEPRKPYPYYIEEVRFKNSKDGITLAGTLTLPKKAGKFPVVILISGSGPQDRNQEISGHKPFLVISDYLTRHGIAVLRFDDRGVGKSTGQFHIATSTEFATDVSSAVAYLKARKEIDYTKLGLIGHSEGGVIAPIVASQSDDINFIVLLAAMGLRGDELLNLQGKTLQKAMGMPEAERIKSNELRIEMLKMVSKSSNIEDLRFELEEYLKKALRENPSNILPDGTTTEELISSQVNQVATPWMRYFVNLDPSSALVNVDCPVLALNGDKDLQVPSQENLNEIGKALKKGGNKKVTLIEYPGLNHLFQECETGLPSEYGEIEETFSPTVLKQITDWILNQVN